ncbi:MAG: hypothetical protein A2Y79_01955 [Deltaproteobacteria bacterium RBG_13_43_22]|nr:MAG: hypothetical protein A2Y79_01955 [Deltaproteobacteria bacterium RBG_13_43_22]
MRPLHFHVKTIMRPLILPDLMAAKFFLLIRRKEMMRKKSPKWIWTILSVAGVVVLGLVDWLTGYEFNFFVFYFFPVAFAAWFLGLVASVFFAVFSAMVWFAADFLGDHQYSSSFYAVWNTMIRLVSFLAIGWSVYRMRYLLDREQETSEALGRSLSEIKVLETFLPICSQCKKIRDKQGVWQQLEVYIGQHSDTQFSHGYCPECAKRIMKEAGLLNDKTG